jgi:phage terminase Nu1 subunit (DNA packaging protein)
MEAVEPASAGLLPGAAFDDAELLPVQVAKLLGVSKQRVSTMVKDGDLRLRANGRIRAQDAVAQYLAAVHPGRARARLLKGHTHPDADLAAHVLALERENAALRAMYDGGGAAASADPNSPGASLNTLRAERERLAIQRERLELDATRGRLVQIEEVTAAVAVIGTTIRASLEQLPLALSERVPPEVAALVQGLAVDAVETALSEASRRLGLLAKTPPAVAAP